MKRIVLVVFTFVLVCLSGNTAFGIEEQKLTAKDGEAYDRFGCSVSISGDYAIVGARGDGDNGMNAGAAYVYTRVSAKWGKVVKLTARDGQAGDRFGCSVSISGNYAIVGARFDDTKGIDAGAAYIFERTFGEKWRQIAKLTAGDGQAGDRFGQSVSISGNYAIVGADYDDDNGSDSGAAYVFERSGSFWPQVTKLTAGNGQARDYFGCSVSISGNYAIVGAYGDGGNGTLDGSAYVFTLSDSFWPRPQVANKRRPGFWRQVAKLTAGSAAGKFGKSVSIFDRYAIVGAPEDIHNGVESGTAYVFERSGSNWTKVDKLAVGSSGDYFGGYVSISGNAVIVGAYGDDNNGSNSGAAHIFERTLGSKLRKVAKLTAGDGQAGDRFGESVSISGNAAIVGAYGDADNGTDTGAAYILTY